MRKFTIFLILTFIICFSYGQGPPSKIRMGVKSGSRIDFIFNSINQYTTSGVTYNNYTTISINYSDGGLANDSSWYLWIKPNTVDISDGTNTLPLSTIQVKVDNTTSGIIDCCSGFTALTLPYQRLVQGGGVGGFAANNVTLSWKCGPFATYPIPGVYILDLIVFVTNDINQLP